jgi:tetratricopeptide (TPR) repeat protein
MKYRDIVSILALCALCICIIQPVSAGTEQIRDNATDYYNVAETLLVKGSYQEAIDAFDRALAENTTLIKASDGLLYTYRDKAYAQIQLGKYSDAVASLDQGIALYPKDQMLWNNKGYALFKLDKYQDALSAYDKAISFEQNYTIALINKGDALLKMGRYDEAITAYNKAIESDPGNEAATAGLAAAQKGAASALPMTTIVLVIIVIAAVGIVIWYVKFRTPEAKELSDKKSKENKK